MADGYRYLPQHFGNLIYAEPTSKNTLAEQTLLNTLLSRLSPSPRPNSKASDRPSPGRSAQSMYPGHQPGPNNRLNGGPNAGGRQQMPPALYSHNSQSSQFNHPHQHQNFQPDHSGHAAAMGHASGYSSGILSNSSPYTSNNTLNGHSTSNTVRGGQAQQISEEWALQLRLHKEAQDAHRAMTEGHSGHHFARLKASENKGIVGSAPPITNAESVDADGVTEARRPHMVDKADQRQEWFYLDMSGQGIRNITMNLFDHYVFLKELYLASNKISHIPAEFGKLRSLTLLELSHNLIQSVPEELGMCTSLKQLFLFDNQIHDLPHELGSLSNLDVLGIEGNPLNPGLKQILVEQGTKSLIATLREEAPVPLPPNPRTTVVMNEDSPANLERVKILTWNILHEKYSTTNIYGYTPSGALSWEYRKMSIVQEIRERDADIVCLQEVSMDAHRDFLQPQLAVNGYKGQQFSRSKAKVMSDREANAVDGCAVFYKAKKYILLDKQVIDFATLAINRPDMKSVHDIFNRVMPKDNIGMVCLFESRQSGARIIVANAHLAWEPELADVKLIQTAILMEYVTKWAEKYARWPPCLDKKFIQLAPEEGEEMEILPDPAPSQEYRNNTDIPLFVCGDYNSTADSSVFELLAKGRVAPDHPDFGGRQYGSLTRQGVEHPFHLRSSYSLGGVENVMPFTNYVPTFNGVIDYIWYSSNSLDLISVLGPPDMKYLERVPGFPNYHFPSDHLHLMAEVAIKARKDKKGLPDSEFASR